MLSYNQVVSEASWVGGTHEAWNRVHRHLPVPEQGKKIPLQWTRDVINGWTAKAHLPCIQQYEQIKTWMDNKWYEFITSGRVVICITVRVKEDKPYSHWARALKYFGPAVSVTLWHLPHRWGTAAPGLFHQLILSLIPWLHLAGYNQLQLTESYVLILW